MHEYITHAYIHACCYKQDIANILHATSSSNCFRKHTHTLRTKKEKLYTFQEETK